MPEHTRQQAGGRDPLPISRRGARLIIGGALGHRLLCWLKPPAELALNPWRPPGGESNSKLRRYFGPALWTSIAGKTVIDYGCGDGPDVIELAHAGARRVLGIDPDERSLRDARLRAEAAGVSERCVFAARTTTTADVVVSSDAFEHVSDLGQTLCHIHSLLAPGGVVWASFGPPWFHPKGGHIFSVFPWAHLLFTETALTRWRSQFTPGLGITRFEEAGLNRMSVRRFIETVERSPLRFEYLEIVPIQRLRLLGLHRIAVTRELVAALVKCRLVPRDR